MMENRPWWRRGDHDGEEQAMVEKRETMTEKNRPWWRMGDQKEP